MREGWPGLLKIKIKEDVKTVSIHWSPNDLFSSSNGPWS